MKKILSLLLVGIMVVSVVPTAFATTNYTNGTQVQYNAEADNDNDGQPDHAEAYTVTVPAQLAPGESGNVVAKGTWASNRKLTVTADDDVTLTNSINAADQKVLDVAFPGIELAGSNTAAVADTKAVSVAGIGNALFGTWSGTFYYNVAMSDVAGGAETPTPDPEHPGDGGTTVEPGGGQIVLYIDGVPFLADENMTWSEWIASDYNTEGFLIAKVKNLNGGGRVFDAMINASKDKVITRAQTIQTSTDRININPNYVLDELNSDPWELVEPEVNLITFKIGRTEYQAEDGMTWEQWVNSDYNTDGYTIANATHKTTGSTHRLAVDANKEYYVDLEGPAVFADSIVKGSANYTRSNTLFTIEK